MVWWEAINAEMDVYQDLQNGESGSKRDGVGERRIRQKHGQWGHFCWAERVYYMTAIW